RRRHRLPPASRGWWASGAPPRGRRAQRRRLRRPLGLVADGGLAGGLRGAWSGRTGRDRSLAGAGMSTRPPRVRMVPATHAYVDSLRPVTGAPAFEVLPAPPVPGAPPGQWWPHPGLEPAWVREHAGEQDVVHTHFGLEGRTPAELEEWLDTLDEV